MKQSQLLRPDLKGPRALEHNPQSDLDNQGVVAVVPEHCVKPLFALQN